MTEPIQDNFRCDAGHCQAARYFSLLSALVLVGITLCAAGAAVLPTMESDRVTSVQAAEMNAMP